MRYKFCRQVVALPEEKAQAAYIAADGGGVGIRVPGRNHDAVFVWGQRDDLGDYAWFDANLRRMQHIPLARSSRMHGACTTCTATCGNGVRIGSGDYYESESTIRQGLPGAPTACSGAVAGTSLRRSAGRRSASGIEPDNPQSTTWASAWPSTWRRRPSHRRKPSERGLSGLSN